MNGTQIETNTFGQTLLVGTCQITGRKVSETFRCPVLQMEQILKTSSETSVQGLVWIAEGRYNEAQAIRAERSARRRFLAEISNSELVRFVFTRQETRWLRHPDCKRFAA